MAGEVLADVGGGVSIEGGAALSKWNHRSNGDVLTNRDESGDGVRMELAPHNGEQTFGFRLSASARDHDLPDSGAVCVESL